MMEIKNLSLSFGEKAVLDQFSLTIPQQGVTALSGPSGCGKTTLLRCIAGLERPQSGQISGITPSQSAILFQENRLLPWRTVREHITDVLPPQRQGEAGFFLELAQLEAERDSYPAALVRCLALDAQLYLLDEPFTGVDLDRVRALMDYLRALPVPVLLASHEPEVLSLAHRVVRLEGPPLTVTGDETGPGASL